MVIKLCQKTLIHRTTSVWKEKKKKKKVKCVSMEYTKSLVILNHILVLIILCYVIFIESEILTPY